MENLINLDERYRPMVEKFCDRIVSEYPDLRLKENDKLPNTEDPYGSKALHRFYFNYNGNLKNSNYRYDYTVKQRRVWGFLGEIPYTAPDLPHVPPVCLRRAFEESALELEQNNQGFFRMKPL